MILSILNITPNKSNGINFITLSNGNHTIGILDTGNIRAFDGEIIQSNTST